jgi:hypothetical protein
VGFIVALALFEGATGCASRRGAQGTSSFPSEPTPTEDERALLAAIADADVVFVAEEHQSAEHARRFVRLLRLIEERQPGRLGLVGLEVYDLHQPVLDAFITTGELWRLKATPDQEALRGQRGDPAIIQSFSEVYQALHALSRDRTTGRIKLVAVDRRPSADLPIRAWRAQHSRAEFARWMFTRDASMEETLAAHLPGLIASKQLAVVFIGGAHVQKRGSVRVQLESGTVDVHFLAERIHRRFPRTLVIAQNDPSNTCIDGIERALQKRSAPEPVLIDLRMDPLGKLANIRCADELDYPATRTPENYEARDHFDFYWYTPPRYPASR